MCFSENFCWQTKKIHNFFGDNTRFTPGIEAWSPGTGKMGFRMDTKKNWFRKEKGMTPYWPPVPTSRGTNQPKRYYRGREPIEPRIRCFERTALKCEVLYSTEVKSSSLQHGTREIDPHHVRTTCIVMDSLRLESFPKWLVLLDKMCIAMCNEVYNVIAPVGIEPVTSQPTGRASAK